MKTSVQGIVEHLAPGDDTVTCQVQELTDMYLR